MKGFRHIIAICLLLTAFSAVGSVAFAAPPRKCAISGKVTDAASGEPVYMAYVVAKDLGLWAVTDADGAFLLKDLPAGQISLEVSFLGYEDWQKKLTLSGDLTGLAVKLNALSLSLSEVVVTAVEGGEISSTSKISAQTIEHVQPSSLKDVMQLLPGSITANPSLTSTNQLSIRDIGNTASNIAGTALILDGASVSNDSNMQMLSSGTAMNSESQNVASTAGGGVDARQVATDNIESVEVIRGIPSVVYGDLTSGAVVVKTKAGASPWSVRLKSDPQLKQVVVGKGFKLPEGRGAVNFDTDFANALGDVRTPSSAYRRFNLQTGWSNTFNKVFTINTRLQAHYSNASDRSDPDLVLDELSQSRDMGVRLNVNGRWMLHRPWITEVEYLLAGSIAQQYSRQRKYQGSAGYTPSTTSMQEGESVGFFTQPQYYSDVVVNGIPVDVQARLTARLFGKYGRVSNKVLAGGEWKLQGNKGPGKTFDVTMPPSPGSAAAYRERSFSDIPFLNRLTAYAEDDLSLPLGPTVLELRTGLRANLILAESIATDNFSCLEPRINVKYHLIRKNTGFRALSVRAGRGLSCKMPSMIYLYPEPAYKDLVSFSYNDFDANNYGLAVITTARAETANPELRLQKSLNTEFGLEFDSGTVSGSIVWYDERMTDGYGFTTEFLPVEYRRYGYSWAGGSPSQTTLPSGASPVYSNGSVSSAGSDLPYISDTTFIARSVPSNNISNHKRGLEFTLEFPTIKAINTTVSVSGAWQQMELRSGGLTSRLYGGLQNGRSYPYVGIYAGSSTSSNGSIRERLNTNVRFVTHIPRIAMVFTLTAQMVFNESTTYLCEYDGLSLPYYYNDSGNRVSGAAVLTDTEHTKYISPLYIMGRDGQIVRFTQLMEQDPAYRNLLLTTNTATYYLKQSFPFYSMLNLRLTKEMKGATISFYANNFLNMKGRVRNSVTGYPSDKNTPIYFGAEVKLTIR